MKTQTTAALCAKEVRKDLKQNFPTTKFSVTSSTFSMGNAVDIKWTDGPTTKQVDEVVCKYQYGHFNGMEDIYEYSNRNEDIPQAKWVMANRKLSEETIKNFARKYKKEFGAEELPDELHKSFILGNEYYNWYQLAWRELKDTNLENKYDESNDS